MYLDAFFECAQVGNFTRAAEKLNITQSALSQRIRNLEEDLGTSLFVRDPSGVRLTEAGFTLLRYCQSKASIETEVLAQIKGRELSLTYGIIRIGGFSSVMRSIVLPALAELLTENPQIQISFISEEVSELPNMLKRGEIDYMILNYDLGRDELVTEKLGVERNVLVSRRGQKVPDIYLDHDEEDMTTIRYLKQAKMSLKIMRRYFDDVYGILDAATLGVGKAVVPLHLIDDTGSLSIHNKDQQLLVPVVLHYYRQDFYSKLHDLVVSALVQNCKKFL